MVWNKVRRYAAAPGGTMKQNNWKSEGDETLRVFKGVNTKIADREHTDHAALPPFVLRKLNNTGAACSECNWLKACLGCAIPFDNKTISKSLSNNDSVAIDWNPDYTKKYLDVKEMSIIHNSKLVAVHKKQMRRTITIRDCMARFTRDEKFEKDAIPVCPKCKTCHDDTTKTLE
jgi:hypothetical protein